MARFIAIALVFIFSASVGEGADNPPVAVTITKQAPIETLSSTGDVVGVGEAAVGTRFSLVSADGSRVTLQDAQGIHYRIALSATDYSPPAAASTTANTASPTNAPGVTPNAVVASPKPIGPTPTAPDNSNKQASSSAPISSSLPGSPPDTRGGFKFQFDGAVPAQKSLSSTDCRGVDLKSENYYLFIPPTYDGSEAYGLVAFIDAGNEPSIPPGWDEALPDKKLLFIAAQKVGNDQKVGRREAVSVAGILKMMELYKVNAKRIYVAGFSGGARMAADTSFDNPDLISGFIGNCGVNYYRAVPRSEATRTDEYGLFSGDPTSTQKARQNEKFALITGSDDFRRGNIRDIYNGGFLKDGFQVKLWDLSGMSHEYCSGPIFREVIGYLDSKTPAP